MNDLGANRPAALGRIIAVVGMVGSALLVPVGIALFGWGGYLGAFVPDGSEPGPNGEGPFELPALVCIILGLALVVGGGRAFAACFEYAWPERDLLDDAERVVIVLYALGALVLAFVVVWIILRVTGVVGPLIWDHGF